MGLGLQKLTNGDTTAVDVQRSTILDLFSILAMFLSILRDVSPFPAMFLQRNL
jgi:hypothetical protein